MTEDSKEQIRDPAARQPGGRAARLARKYAFLLGRPDRLQEYADCLREAIGAEYTIVPYQEWLRNQSGVHDRILLLRHDIDAYPASASAMSDIEHRLGVASTYYFRWNTWDPSVAERIRDNGSNFGLHYETLTRYAIENGLTSPGAVNDDVIAACRSTLRAEIARFADLGGECRTVVAHGDYRRKLIGVDNDFLLRGEDPATYSLEANGDDAQVKSQIQCYVCDGEGYPTFWTKGISFHQALAAAPPVLLFNSHPHHWVTGARTVTYRVAEQLRFVARHPLGWERGKPEAAAWHAFERCR